MSNRNSDAWQNKCNRTQKRTSVSDNQRKKIGKVLTVFIQKQISPLPSLQTDKSKSSCSLNFKQTPADLKHLSSDLEKLILKMREEVTGEISEEVGGGKEKERRLEWGWRDIVWETERKKKADHCAGGSHSVTWDRKRGGVTLPIISHACGPPGRLNTRLFSACRGEVPQEEGESWKDRVRVTRTTLLKSPGRRVTHSEMLLSWRGGA